MKEQDYYSWQETPEMWQALETEIVCRSGCTKSAGTERTLRRIEHDTVIYTVKCIECGAKAMDWGYDT